jgi:hypothetical protein
LVALQASTVEGYKLMIVKRDRGIYSRTVVAPN